MLGRIRRDLERALRTERNVPVRVEYGPLASGLLAQLGDAVVIQYDQDAGDETGAPMAIGGNPRRRFNRAVSCLVRVHAKATVAGARRQDHEDRCQLIVDQVILALDDVLRGGELDVDGVQIAGTQYLWAQGRGKFETLSGDETSTPVGASYVLPFVIQRGVRDTPFDGSALDEFLAEADSFSSTTKVYGPTGEGAGQTACGD